MGKKVASIVQRSIEISDDERIAARNAVVAFNKFLKQLWAARQHDQRLVNVLNSNKDASPNDLFKIRHLLRRYQREVRDRYASLIMAFAGKKDNNMQSVSKGYIHSLQPLEKDTITRQIKGALQDAMQQLTEFLEEFLEAFEDFNNPDQIKSIIGTSKKADNIVQSIENIIDNQMKPHFERNILKRKKLSTIRGHIIKRARLIKMLEI
jgi:coenzyme F420-reducing hydrogenase alpha subunit